mgnify:FL=1
MHQVIKGQPQSKRLELPLSKIEIEIEIGLNIKASTVTIGLNDFHSPHIGA